MVFVDELWYVTAMNELLGFSEESWLGLATSGPLPFGFGASV